MNFLLKIKIIPLEKGPTDTRAAMQPTHFHPSNNLRLSQGSWLLRYSMIIYKYDCAPLFLTLTGMQVRITTAVITKVIMILPIILAH